MPFLCKFTFLAVGIVLKLAISIRSIMIMIFELFDICGHNIT